MGIARLFDRFRARRRVTRHHHRAHGRVRLGQAFRAEPLERRAMLTVSTTFVDDAWEFVTDSDLSMDLSAGDIVNNGNNGQDGMVAAEYGVTGFGTVTTGDETGSLVDYDTIAEAIAATSNGGETRVLHFASSAALTVTTPIMLSGVFTIPSGNLTLDNANAVLAPGAGSSGGETGMMYLDSGNLALDAGTLYIKISDTNSASKVKVDGTVSIDPSVELRIATGSASTASQSYTIIENDFGDDISGTFAGLGQGATLYAGDRRYTISYTGGDGNDVVLTLVGTEAFTTYVHDAWTPVSGNTVTDGTITTEFETQSSPVNGFTTSGWETITEAVDAVAERGSVQILHSPSGGYAEDVTIDKQLILMGPFELDGELTVQADTYATIIASSAGGTIRVNELALASDTTLSMFLNPDGTSDQFEVEDSVDLGGATLDLTSGPILNSTPADIVLVDNEGGSAISGTFAGLPEGAALVLEGQQYWITYEGGDGNDVELIVPSGEVIDRHIFYNNSYYDGNSTSINSDDDDAIDPSKTAYKPGDDPTTFEHITGYSKGINGIMIDLAGNGNHASITANDFFFTVGNNNSPESWSAAPAPSAVSVRTGAGVSSSDRIEITWADGDIQKQWLAVHVLATINTGLATPDVFYWGNAVGGSGDGDTSTGAPTNASDELGARNNPHNFLNPALVDDAYDYNKDRFVNASDELISRNNGTGFLTQLKKIDLAVAPEVADLFGGTELRLGEEATFIASVPVLPGTTAPDPDVVGVDFYLDVNSNGVLDDDDDLLVAGDPIDNNQSELIGWEGTFVPDSLDEGTSSILAVPIGANGPMGVANILPITIVGNGPSAPPAPPGAPIVGVTIATAAFDVGSIANGTAADTVFPSQLTAVSGRSGSFATTDGGGVFASSGFSQVNLAGQVGAGLWRSSSIFGTAGASLGLTSTNGNTVTAGAFGESRAVVNYTVASTNAPVGTRVNLLVTGFIASFAGSAGLDPNAVPASGMGNGNVGRITVDNVQIADEGPVSSTPIPPISQSFAFDTGLRIIPAVVGDTITVAAGSISTNPSIGGIVYVPTNYGNQWDAVVIEWYTAAIRVLGNP